MEIGPAIMSGVVGVAATTIIHNMLPFIGLPRVNLAGVLGTWILNPGSRAAVLGLTLHFTFGAIFGLTYAWLWSMGIGSVDYQWGIMFGAVHGLIAAAIVPVLLHRFPRPNEMLEGPTTLIALFVLHVLFGLIVSLQYRAFVGLDMNP
jgi:hypothetical protein